MSKRSVAAWHDRLWLACRCSRRAAANRSSGLVARPFFPSPRGSGETAPEGRVGGLRAHSKAAESSWSRRSLPVSITVCASPERISSAKSCARSV